jgi:hypothetical protein
MCHLKFINYLKFKSLINAIRKFKLFMTFKRHKSNKYIKIIFFLTRYYPGLLFIFFSYFFSSVQ